MTAEALWLRAVAVAAARGLLPADTSRRTPGELAADAAGRGDDRFIRLVYDWYYPASYGRTSGTLSDHEATLLVAGLEAEIASAAALSQADTAEQAVARTVEPPRVRTAACELCGFPATPEPSTA